MRVATPKETKQMKYVIGIDPGKSGYIVRFYEDGHVHAFPMPIITATTYTTRDGKKKKHGKDQYDYQAIARTLACHCIEPKGTIIRPHADLVYAVCERQSTRPGQSVVSARSSGEAEAIWRSMFFAFGIRHEIATPQTWQNSQHRGQPGSDPKQRSILAAGQFFPEVNLVPPGCRKPHDGLADALLIARYGGSVYWGDKQ